MISRVGDDVTDEIILPNQMIIYIQYGIDELCNDRGYGRFSGKWRKVQLLDKQRNVISEVVERNPAYVPDLPELDISTPDGVIY